MYVKYLLENGANIKVIKDMNKLKGLRIWYKYLQKFTKSESRSYGIKSNR